MEQIITSNKTRSLLSTHQVLRNTYFLLALTLSFSALVAFVSLTFSLPMPAPIVSFFMAYGLLFLTHLYSNSGYGILVVFAFTGFLGYTIAPWLNIFMRSGASDILLTALGGTALVFFSCSAYVLMARKDMSFARGMLTAGSIVLLVSMVANVFLNIPSFALAISMMFILFSSGVILLKTSEIIHGGETNYIRATVTLYVALYNIFMSLLQILSARRNNQ